jgi:hypothetical protein
MYDDTEGIQHLHIEVNRFFYVEIVKKMCLKAKAFLPAQSGVSGHFCARLRGG